MCVESRRGRRAGTVSRKVKATGIGLPGLKPNHKPVVTEAGWHWYETDPQMDGTEERARNYPPRTVSHFMTEGPRIPRGDGWSLR